MLMSTQTMQALNEERQRRTKATNRRSSEPTRRDRPQADPAAARLAAPAALGR
jgi:hypothetical protein